MQIFLARNNVQAGPYDVNQLNIMLASGEVTLEDLIWHEGLDQWQRLGNLTNNQYVYYPSSANTNPANNDSIINNVTVFPEDDNTKKDSDTVSIDRLYGKPERPKTDAKIDMTTNRQLSPSANISLNKKNTKPISATDKVIGDVVLAPIMSRLLATAINALLYILSIIPLVMALSKMDIDYTKFQDFRNMEAAMQYSTTLIESIPSATLTMSQAMIFGLFTLQFIFIMLRGQSIGKLLTGIRVVDLHTHRLPSFFKLIFSRTLLLFIIYNLLFSFTSIFGFFVIAVHYFMAAKSPQNMGWHDKLAKTLVVRADNAQLSKPTKLPKAK